MLRTENLKMAEKIGVAIYFISNFFDDKEPLKWKLRTLSTNLVSYSIRDKSEIIKEISSLFYIAKNTNLMSDINYDILMKELSKLDVEEKKSLEISSFSEEKKNLPTSPAIFSPRESIKDKAKSLKKNSRQDIIISILRRKKEVMIKDISPLISGCSDKTIQRELLSMVKTGVLKKLGEKRWSRYSLA